MITLKHERRQMKVSLVCGKGGYCLDCNMDLRDKPECADFDHVSGEKEGNVSRMMARVLSNKDSGDLWERMWDELDKCELVCSNCHRTRTVSRASVS